MERGANNYRKKYNFLPMRNITKLKGNKLAAVMRHS